MERFLSANGLNAQALLANTQKAQDVAGDVYYQNQPLLARTYNTVSATSPGILAKYAVGLVAVYYLVRPALPCRAERVSAGACLGVASPQLPPWHRLLLGGAHASAAAAGSQLQAYGQEGAALTAPWAST